MNQPENTESNPTFTRREILQGAGVLLGASLLGCDAEPGQSGAENLLAPGASTARRRIAIVGGGAGGIGAAYLLSPQHDVEIFEAGSKIGGHCDSRVVEYKGVKVNVDLGAQFFHPDTHPSYVSLLEELGLYNPDNPKSDESIEAPGSICIFAKNAFLPVFSSKHPYLTPFFAVDFLIYSQYARNVILQNQSWEMTLAEWVGSLPVTQKFKDSLVFPWISATIGTTIENAKRSSARSILQTFALAFPANIFAGASTFNSALGLEGNLRRMLDRSPGVQVNVNSAVQGLSYQDGNWTVQTASGNHGPYSAVVMNAPPQISKTLLQPLAWASDIVPVLNKYETFETRMLIHTDAKYANRDKNFWAVYNGMVEGSACEGSIWYGGIHEKLPTGGTLDIFKSWASRRSADPANIIYERRFHHPLITPEGIRAARTMRGFQGRNSLYFSGQAMTGFDLQESALYSAMKVAETLAPTSSTLASLKARMVKRGRKNINYDL